jgi:hypothetical protein
MTEPLAGDEHMDDQSMNENKKSFWQNDKLLVCSMLSFYGLCIIGLIAGTFVWLGQRNQEISVNATSTAQAVVTQQANATATAIVRATEQAKFGFVERFDSNKQLWRAGQENNEYWKGEIKIADGIYTWDIKEAKDNFISWSDFPFNNDMDNFHVYVDTKLIANNPGDVCSGFLFRVAEEDWDKGGYYFSLCNDSTATVSYHTEKDGWENITRLYDLEHINEWNRLEVIGRDSHFEFFINGEQVYEMDDDRQSLGGLALVIEVNEKVPVKVLFDNFGLQR